MIQAQVGGSVAAGFEPVREAFAANFEQHGEVGAACCVHLHGKRIVDLWGGVTAPGGSQPYTADTLQMVWSTTKGVVAMAAHILAQEGKLDFDAPVTDYWPEFAAEGKDGIPVRWLFCHKSGLAAVDRPLGLADVVAWTPCVDALAAQRPYWEPGTAHGYHTWTYGWLAGEVIRRVTGQSVGAFVAERIAKPLQAEFWIGLPEAMDARVAPVIPPAPAAPALRRIRGRRAWPIRTPSHTSPGRTRPCRLRRSMTTSSGERRSRPATASGPRGPLRASTLPALERWTACAYSSPRPSSRPPSSRPAARTSSRATRPVSGPASSCRSPSGRWRARDPSATMEAAARSAFAHPELGISLGYTMNQMRPVYGKDPRTTGLVEALLTCLR